MAGGRKRVVKKDTVAEVAEEDEPVVKKGRGERLQRTAKAAGEKKREEQIDVKQESEEEEEYTIPTLKTKPKRGAKARKSPKLKEEVKEEESRDENHELEEEEVTQAASEPEMKKGKRGRKPVVKTEDKEAPAGGENHELEEEEEMTPAASEPEMKKGKRGRKPAVKTEDEAKKRGRPAKEEAVEEESEATIKKGKRGRKPAVKLEKEEEAAAASSQRGKRVTATAKQEVEEEATTSKKPQRGRPKASKVKQEEDDVDIDESPASDETTQEKGKAASSAKASGGRKTKPKVAKGKKGGANAITAEEKENTDITNLPKKSGIKTGVERVLIVKGRAAVDALCPIAQNSHVYEEEDDIWDCMLNQTNIQHNNNKYYLIQLLEDDARKTYSVWMRWGRVGANGQNSLQPCGSDLDKAMNIFRKKFADKTKNDWEERFMFDKVPGKYDLLKMDYSKGTDTPDTAAAIKKSKEKVALESVLHPVVRAVIELICDVKRMEEAVVEMKYDARKAPLGKLTTDQIKAGYLALKEIDNLIRKDKYTNKDLVQACNDFYTRVPHYFGMKVPPLIRTSVEVREKVALLEALGDIQAALSVLDQPIDVNTHPADHQYSRLKCDMTPLDKDSQEYKIIEKYMSTTHAKTHNHYKLKLIEVLACHKESESQRFKDVGNRMLLWHGSRMSNWAGILSQGLRVAPPEAPVTGYMFGKGIYFADMASKSANYCWATTRNTVGFLMLSEVALGNSNILLHADYDANKLPHGCHSVKACGKTAPKPENFTKLPDGTVVPIGPGVQQTAKGASNYSLLYNEFIVYDPAQVRTRFLLKVEFDFK